MKLNVPFYKRPRVIITRGKKRTCISDLSSGGIILAPNSLYDFIEENKGKTITKIKSLYSKGSHENIDDYFQFMLDNYMIFFTNDSNSFMELNTEWKSPFLISNGIIDFGKELHPIHLIYEFFEKVNCKYLLLRFYRAFDLNYINDLITYLNRKESIIQYIEIISNKNEYSLHDWTNIINSHSRIRKLIICGFAEEKTIQIRHKTFLIITSQKIISRLSCGVISNKSFVINTSSFIESQHHNSCLNRKISIDVNGDIKNCPSMAESYGNIKDTSLEEAINKPGFKKYWNVTKDQIDICKDCEFRYVCTDCRAYTERTTFKEDIDLSKPLKCGYNPYTNEWAEWSTNPLKEKAIEYYGMQELVKKND